MKLIFLFIAVLFSSCDFKTKIKKAYREKSLENQRARYNILIPSGWTSEHRDNKGRDILIMTAPATELDSGTNIIVTTGNMEGESLETSLSDVKKMIKRRYPTSVYVGSGKINVNNNKGIWSRFQISIDGDTISSLYYAIERKDLAYIITCSSSGSFEYYKPIFDSVARSLSFNE